MENDGFSDNETNRDVAETRRARDFDDLQNEIAERDTGRQRRFLVNGDGGERSGKKGKNKDRLSALELLLLNDLAYASLYRDVSGFLRSAESATEQAIKQTLKDLSEAQDALDDTLDNANKLPDGAAIFKDDKGNVWTADGRLVEAEELDGVVWKEDAPSHEDYLSRKNTATDAQTGLDALYFYQVDVLGNARDQLNDPDNPPSKDELDRIRKDIEERAPQSIKNNFTPIETPVSEKTSLTSAVDIPKL